MISWTPSQIYKAAAAERHSRRTIRDERYNTVSCVLDGNGTVCFYFIFLKQNGAAPNMG